jgi:mannose-6-phosphate isomerase
MAPTPLHPLRFTPIFKRMIWGGRRLHTLLEKPIGPEDCYAESWEVSDHGQDVSRVADGPLEGTTLREILQTRGPELLGPALAKDARQFPLLVKFLDAHQVLSVQVHPDDDLGMRLANDNGKTEAWVILHAELGSLIYAGLRSGVTRERFPEALDSGHVEPLLHHFPANPGDCIMIPAGTVHAIGAGVVLAEIQQMSDATFRVHDWGRLGADGNPRQLHLSEALESTNYDAGPVDPVRPEVEPIPGGIRERLARCPYFALERLRLNGEPAQVGRSDRFTLLLGLEGEAELRHRDVCSRLKRGETLLLPASVGPCTLRPVGEATVLSCVVP